LSTLCTPPPPPPRDLSCLVFTPPCPLLSQAWRVTLVTPLYQPVPNESADDDLPGHVPSCPLSRFPLIRRLMHHTPGSLCTPRHRPPGPTFSHVLRSVAYPMCAIPPCPGVTRRHHIPFPELFVFWSHLLLCTLQPFVPCLPPTVMIPLCTRTVIFTPLSKPPPGLHQAI